MTTRPSGSRWPPARSPSRMRSATSATAGRQDRLHRADLGRQGRLRYRVRGWVQGQSAEKAEPEKTAINAFGLEVQPLTAELAKPLGPPGRPQGRCWCPPSRKAALPPTPGIQEGDVITKVVHNRKDPVADQRPRTSRSWPRTPDELCSLCAVREAGPVRHPVPRQRSNRFCPLIVRRLPRGRRRSIVLTAGGEKEGAGRASSPGRPVLL